MKKVLVLVADYPNNKGGVTLMYVHTRNLYYKVQGVEVDVLNFSAKEGYIYEEIKVISLEEYVKNEKEYDVLILHAPNIRNHYVFLKKYADRFKRLIFFFHGHEVLKIRDTYSKPYKYMKNRGIKNSFFQDLYDGVKLYLWRKYLPRISYKADFIFVSEWMLNKFLKYVRIPKENMNYYIIANSIGKIFEMEFYDASVAKEFDFVTIRNNIDGSKYAIDFVNNIAKANKKYKFLVVGQGVFFEHNEKADNLTWWNRTLKHEEIVGVLNKSKYALMPTRLDAQGVMMCEMASFGIPVITSNIDICEELQGIFDNMILVENDSVCDIEMVLENNRTRCKYEKNKAFYACNTIGEEVKIIKGGVPKKLGTENGN